MRIVMMSGGVYSSPIIGDGVRGRHIWHVYKQWPCLKNCEYNKLYFAVIGRIEWGHIHRGISL